MPSPADTLAIMEAQRDNIARIATGLILAGSTPLGEQIVLNGPRPNIIRLYDQADRYIQSSALANWERLVTILPEGVEPEDRVVNRIDELFRYQIQLLVRLTKAEEMADAASVYVNGVKSANPLATKMHNLWSDVWNVFYENLTLATDACPGGLVADAKMSTAWDPEATYPYSLMVLFVECHISGV